MTDAKPEAPTRAQLLGRSVGSEVVFAVVAAAVLLACHRSPLAAFESRMSPWVQIASGLIAGVAVGGAAAQLLLRAAVFDGARRMIAETIRTAPLGISDLALISLVAGLGEEFLFRGALQTVIGLWWSTAIFTVVHAWVPLKGWARAVYMLFVVSTSLLLGVIFARLGLAAAMTAHASIDLAILILARRALLRFEERGAAAAAAGDS